MNSNINETVHPPLPTILQPYAAQLKTFEKEYIKITPEPVGDDMFTDLLPMQQSKLIGIPFLPKDRKYPIDSDGLPMIPFAQINFAEIPKFPGFPDKGLLQVYFSEDFPYDMQKYQIEYISAEELNKESHTDFSFLTEDKEHMEGNVYSWHGATRVHKMAFSKGIDKGSTQDIFRFNPSFDGRDIEDMMHLDKTKHHEAIVTYFDTFECKIGGYAQYGWEDHICFCRVKDENDILLLQIVGWSHFLETDGKCYSIFINPKDLKNRDFDKAYLI